METQPCAGSVVTIIQQRIEIGEDVRIRFMTLPTISHNNEHLPETWGLVVLFILGFPSQGGGLWSGICQGFMALREQVLTELIQEDEKATGLVDW